MPRSGFNVKVTAKKMPPSQVLREIGKEAEQNMNRQLRRLTCPEHGGHPTVKLKPGSGSNLAWDLTACCEDMKAKALALLQQ